LDIGGKRKQMLVLLSFPKEYYSPKKATGKGFVGRDRGGAKRGREAENRGKKWEEELSPTVGFNAR